MYDLIVIGGGPSGYGAAMYAGRYRMKTLVITPDVGGTLPKGHVIENYLGFESIPGMELAQIFEKHVKNHETVEFHSGVVDRLEKKK